MESKDLIQKRKIIHKQKKLKIKTKANKQFNYGLALLKSILAFLVVIRHNFDPRSTKNKIILKITSRNILFHVPSFFIMSFYFMYKNLLSLNPKIILNRFMRLLIPYIGWPIIIFNINRFLNKYFNKKLKDSYLLLKYQFLYGGAQFLLTFWYSWNLIAITLLFILIIFIFRKHALFILQIILICSYVVQYTEYHYKNIFLKYPNYNKFVIASLFESIPFSVTGFTLGYYKILDILKRHKIKSFILSIIIYKVIIDYNIFTRIKGVVFQGIDLNIQSICIIFIFSLFPSEKIKNEYLSKFLIIITNYTAGVYYLHVPIHWYFEDYIDSIKNRTFIGAIINYLICYFICFIGIKIFGKTPIKYLFC